MNLSSLFRKPKTEVKVVLLNREPTTLRLNEWQSDKALVGMAQKLFTNPDWRLMLQVLENEHPGGNVFLDATIDMRAVHQGRCEGYSMALANVRAMCKFVESAPIIEETFGAE